MKNWKTLLLGIAMIANTSFAAPQVVDKVAAVVNNGVVLESDVDGLMQSVKLNAGTGRSAASGRRHAASPDPGTFDYGSNYPADGSEDGGEDHG